MRCVISVDFRKSIFDGCDIRYVRSLSNIIQMVFDVYFVYLVVEIKF